ncbi:hypothetical protein BaRGS_00022024 [Batillaria attramentaria]|uniref:Uncharacterized protein n=1 Tax=Batillaria attramentaria TaxID=370345 RepID=A0ABD0KIC3_9CAEN
MTPLLLSLGHKGRDPRHLPEPYRGMEGQVLLLRHSSPTRRGGGDDLPGWVWNHFRPFLKSPCCNLIAGWHAQTKWARLVFSVC